MTRINVTDPVVLTDQHVMSEYRELPMVMGSLRRSLNSKHGWQPHKVGYEYTLNAGHVYFFTNKKSYLYDRYNALIKELVLRGYDVNPDQRSVDWNVFDNIPQMDWYPGNTALSINTARITERINQKPHWYRYNGVKLNNLDPKVRHQLLNPMVLWKR